MSPGTKQYMGLVAEGAHIAMHAEAGHIRGPAAAVLPSHMLGSLWHPIQTGEHGALAIT